MGVAARMAVMAQIALENVRDSVVPHKGAACNSTARGRSKFSNAPDSIGTGLSEAYSSLSDGLKFAASSVVKRSSKGKHSAQQGYMYSLLQGVLGVGIITAEAATKVLIGVRNSLDPA